MDSPKRRLYEEKMIFRLPEFSEKTGICIEDLIYAAACGTIEVMISVPRDAVLRITASEDSHRDCEIPRPLNEPNLLVLSKMDAWHLYADGALMASRFPLGYLLLPFSDVCRPYLPKSCTEHDSSKGFLFDKNWDCWSLYRVNPSEPGLLSKYEFQVSVDKLFVRREFFSVLKYDDGVPVSRERWMSRYLDQMNVAAVRYWADSSVDPNDASTHPKNEDVAKFLQEEANMTKTLATSAARLLRPDFAGVGRPPKR